MSANPPSPPTSILGVAVRDLGRLRVVAVTVARHGFGEILQRTPLARFLPDTTQPDMGQEPPGIRLRKLLEALGPTWIKFGQILSSRPDLVSAEYLEALAELQDHAPVVAWEDIKHSVEQGLGRSLEEAFADFQQEPLATASIAQTHIATTHQGQRVVVKVQRPGIGPQMRGDLNLIYLAARALEAAIDELEIYTPGKIVEAFERDLMRELNFTIELGNLMTARQLLDHERPVVVPEPVPELSSRTILTMELFEGKSLRALEPGSEAAAHAVEEVLHAACKQVFHDGFFHADPHPGNILVDDGGVVCFIDWGMAGRLSVEQRSDLVRLILAAISGDLHAIARVFLRMGTPMGRVPMAEFKAEIGRIRSRYLVVSGLEDVDTAGFATEFVSAAQRFRIRLNPEYSLLFKAAATLEGVVRGLHPEVDLIRIGRPYLDELVREQLSPGRMMQEAMSSVTGVGSMLRDLPSQLDQVLHDLETGNLQIRAATPEMDRLPNLVFSAASRVSMALFAASMSISAAILLPNDPTRVGGIPLLSVALITLASIAWFALWWWHFLGQGRPIRVSPALTLLQRFLPENDDKS